MHILWICPFFPYPPNNGSRIREYNLIRAVSQHHTVTLFSLMQDADEQQYIPPMGAYCDPVVPVLLTKGLSGHRRASDVLPGLLDPQPRYIYGAPLPDGVQKLDDLLHQHDFDVVLVETLYMTNYIWDMLDRIPTVKILVEHNVETLIQREQIGMVQSGVRKLRKQVYYWSFTGFEKRACHRFDHIITVSALDRDHLIELLPDYPESRISVIPNGVDTQNLQPDASITPTPHSIIYNGAVTYDANEDAVRYFAEDVLPLLRQRVPDATFAITGGTGDVDVSALKQQPGVIFTGYLDSVGDAVQSSAAVVIPLRHGGGTRLKVLEAMALGVPVISTRKGAEGIHVTDGENILLADQPDELVTAIVRVFEDTTLRDRLAAGGRSLVEREYDWSIIGQQMADLLETIAEKVH